MQPAWAFIEVTNDHIRPAISISSYASVINLEAMERLPADIQRVLVQTLNEHVWRVTAHNEIANTIALRQAYEAHVKEIRELPDDVLAAMDEAAARIWQAQAQKGDKAAGPISKMGALRKELGHL